MRFSCILLFLLCFCYADDNESSIVDEPLLEAKKIFEKARELFYSRKTPSISQISEGIDLLKEASKLSHAAASLLLGEIYLFGKFSTSVNLPEAANLFSRLADEGNSQAQSYLGFLYSYGLGVKRDMMMSLIYHRFAAAGEIDFSHLALGFRYLQGIGVPKSCENAAEFYIKVAKKIADYDQKSTLRSYPKIRITEDLESSSSSISQDDIVQYYQYSADRGDPSAQLTIGQVFYYGGNGLQQSFENALPYLKMAAQNGNPTAMGLLGQMYWKGEGVKKDSFMALHYFRQGAALGNPVALNGMGLMYKHGIGMKADVGEALKSFMKASEKDNPDAHYNIAMMLRDVGIGASSVNQYLELGARHGHLLSLFELGKANAVEMENRRTCNLAVLYLKNVSEKHPETALFKEGLDDYKKGFTKQAFMKFLWLSELGMEVAQFNAAYILEKNFDQPQFAMLLWNRSSNQGHSFSQVKVGDYFYYGKGVVSSPSLAAMYYQSAEQDRNAQAMFNLGFMHEYGIGLSQDNHLARRYYDKTYATDPDSVLAVYLMRYKMDACIFFSEAKEILFSKTGIVILTIAIGLVILAITLIFAH